MVQEGGQRDFFCLTVIFLTVTVEDSPTLTWTAEEIRFSSTLCGVSNTLVFRAVGSVLQPFLLIAPYLSLPLPKTLCRHFFPNHPSTDTLYTGSCAARLSVFDNFEKEYESPHPMNQSLPP